jgi:GTP cyclohydrolase I
MEVDNLLLIEAEMHLRKTLTCLGFDISKPGLRKTPERIIKFWAEFLTPKDFEFTLFDLEGSSEMIVISDIPVISMCEHHFAPFTGTAVVGYIPTIKIAGLSKIARTVEYFSRRFQTQERLTSNIANFIQEKIPQVAGVGVIVRAQHSCMCVRGIRTPNSWTTTSCLLGIFRNNGDVRKEFMSLAAEGFN